MDRRLFVKGLSDEDVHDDTHVQSLFASFGLRVRNIERFGPYKERVFYRGNGKRVRVRYGRRFAFLDVCPLQAGAGAVDCGDALDVSPSSSPSSSRDASPEVEDPREVAFRNALQRAIRSLNGATWKGATLRCQFATERWDEKLRREIAEEAAAAEVVDAGDAGDAYGVEEAARHAREQTGGENTLRFEDEDEDGVEVGMDRGALWAEITEAPRQWVYNYERRLQEVADAKPRGGRDEDEGRKKSLVERFLEEQDVARAKRREDREQRVKDSFGTVYAGTRDARKRKQRDGGTAKEEGEEEEEERMAVVDFWSDGEDDVVAGSAGFAAKGSARGVDLSRFEDSDSDGAMDVDVGGERDAVGEDATSDDEGSDGSDGSDGRDGGGGDDVDDGDDGGADGGTPGGHEDEDEDDSADGGDDSDKSGDVEDDSHSHESGDDSEEDDVDARDQYATASKVFPNAAAFHAPAPLDQAQASLNAQADRIRSSLKTYRKKTRRLVKK